MAIEIGTNMYSLNYVNLWNVTFCWGMTATLTSFQKYIEVTDSLLWCLLPEEITCIMHGEDIQQCYGLIMI